MLLIMFEMKSKSLNKTLNAFRSPDSKRDDDDRRGGRRERRRSPSRSR